MALYHADIAIAYGTKLAGVSSSNSFSAEVGTKWGAPIQTERQTRPTLMSAKAVYTMCKHDTEGVLSIARRL
jgi:hypothetical protein